jgi:hypothetical protein
VYQRRAGGPEGGKEAVAWPRSIAEAESRRCFVICYHHPKSMRVDMARFSVWHAPSLSAALRPPLKKPRLININVHFHLRCISNEEASYGINSCSHRRAAPPTRRCLTALAVARRRFCRSTKAGVEERDLRGGIRKELMDGLCSDSAPRSWSSFTASTQADRSHLCSPAQHGTLSVR